MEHAQPQKKQNGETHGSVKIDHRNGQSNGQNGHSHSFNPNGYMLKLPKKKKITLGDGQVKYIRVEADYLPVAPRIAWFRLEHPDWSIVTKAVYFAGFRNTGFPRCSTGAWVRAAGTATPATCGCNCATSWPKHGVNQPLSPPIGAGWIPSPTRMGPTPTYGKPNSAALATSWQENSWPDIK